MMNYLFPVSQPDKIQTHAMSEGERQARHLYPHVMRDRSDVEQLARDFTKGEAGSHPHLSHLQAHTDNMDVYIRFFVPVFVSAYFDKVAALDKEKSYSTAKLVVREEEHSTMGRHSYRISLTDTRYLKKPVEFILEIDNKGEASLSDG